MKIIKFWYNSSVRKTFVCKNGLLVGKNFKDCIFSQLPSKDGTNQSSFDTNFFFNLSLCLLLN